MKLHLHGLKLDPAEFQRWLDGQRSIYRRRARIPAPTPKEERRAAADLIAALQKLSVMLNRLPHSLDWNLLLAAAQRKADWGHMKADVIGNLHSMTAMAQEVQSTIEARPACRGRRRQTDRNRLLTELVKRLSKAGARDATTRAKDILDACGVPAPAVKLRRAMLK